MPNHSDSSNSRWGPQALRHDMEARQRHHDEQALNRDRWVRANEYYYDRLKALLRLIVDPGKRVLEVRCQTGDLLEAMEPSYGFGVELSERAIEIARNKHPEFHFVQAQPEDLELDEKFDYVLLTHLYETVDLLRTLERVRPLCHPDTRILLHSYNLLWQPVLELSSRLHLRPPLLEPNWLSEHDLKGFLQLAGFEPLRTHHAVLFPKYVPLVSSFFNKLLAPLPGIRRLCLMTLLVARPQPQSRDENATRVSVIVPCLNEQGNIEMTAQRIPEMGKHTEIIFCDDRSTDNTRTEIERAIRDHPERDMRLVHGPGICKADNVWAGFRAAQGDVLMILDADLTVMPEELPYFFRALVSGRGEFINGSRLVYPIQRQAMQFTNRFGNWFFALLFSYLLGQRVKDTLCGTKVLWRRDWQRIERNLGFWGEKDLWGDYELLLGAAKLHLRIQEVPVHYQERVFGVTKMTKVFANGWRMLRICCRAWLRLQS